MFVRVCVSGHPRQLLPADPSWSRPASVTALSYLFVHPSIKFAFSLTAPSDMTRLYESIFLATPGVHHDLFILNFYERLCLLSPRLIMATEGNHSHYCFMHNTVSLFSRIHFIVRFNGNLTEHSIQFGAASTLPLISPSFLPSLSSCLCFRVSSFPFLRPAAWGQSGQECARLSSSSSTERAKVLVIS